MSCRSNVIIGGMTAGYFCLPITKLFLKEVKRAFSIVQALEKEKKEFSPYYLSFKPHGWVQLWNETAREVLKDKDYFFCSDSLIQPPQKELMLQRCIVSIQGIELIYGQKKSNLIPIRELL